MAYRPKIKNANGTLTDLPLEAETAVKLKTARTIADIEGEECINAGHLSEAFSYRNPL